MGAYDSYKTSITIKKYMIQLLKFDIKILELTKRFVVIMYYTTRSSESALDTLISKEPYDHFT